MIKKFGKALPYALAGAIAMNTFTGCGISKNVESPVAIQELEFEDIDDSEKIQNLSFIDKNSFEQEIEKPKKNVKKYKERRKLENEERIKMEIEEKR